MKKLRFITIILCSISAIIFCGIINIMGGFGLYFNTYEQCGVALFISSSALLIGTFLAIFGKTLFPIILNIIGSFSYIYVLAYLTSAAEKSSASENLQNILNNHYPTIIVTVLLFALIFMNFFTDKNIARRNARKADKKLKNERELTENEKIL